MADMDLLEAVKTKVNSNIKKNNYFNILPDYFLKNKSEDQIHAIHQKIECLNSSNVVSVEVFGQGCDLTVRVYLFNHAIHLSKWVPIFDSMHMDLVSQENFYLDLDENHISILEMKIKMTIAHARSESELEGILNEMISTSIQTHTELDQLNALIFLSGLSVRQIHLVRAFTHYLLQTQLKVSQKQISQIILNCNELIKNMVSYFEVNFNPNFSEKADSKKLEALDSKIKNDLSKIVKLEEDQVMNLIWSFIQATQRTNYFLERPIISFKLLSKKIANLPKPVPLFEMFVYSSEFEGIHLRSTEISRGGIRFSDRIDDYRTEILGLMKAQKVKNAVIVPSGAKGGFVIKKQMKAQSPEEYKKSVRHYYEQFISSLLALTDNLQDGQHCPPKQVRCLDGMDPYFVVAADKGTASFSDVANEIAGQHQFWMKDAFASGGSKGYSHKELGITARGAWTSLESHLRDLGIYLTEESVSVVGIGDMSGDVFGNAMLLSSKIKLIAAFDHRHIFIDPSPDPLQSYIERKRLFSLPYSSWSDYQSNLISRGGGVFSRDAKSIALTPQMRSIFSAEKDELTPDEFIQAILRSKVHVIFNGGIGTFIKSSIESDSDVRDKLNDGARVNANEVRAIAIVEGGNLGVTQLGRIEYAAHGGRINADFIDNAAGVNCSDKEVNIKILLDDKRIFQQLSEEDRNHILQKLKPEVVDLVLSDNYEQALLLNYSAQHSAKYVDLYRETLKNLENTGILDRKVEFLPDEKTLEDRKLSEQGFTRPEMAVLMAYIKIHLKNEIMKSELLEDDFFEDAHLPYFPKSLVSQHREALLQHRLKDQIKGTVLSNYIVNRMGITFLQRITNETRESLPLILKAFYLTDRIYQADQLYKIVFKLDDTVSTKLQYEMLHYIRYAMHLGTRWFLKSGRIKKDTQNLHAYYKQAVHSLINKIPDLVVGKTKDYFQKLKQKIPEGVLTDQEIHKIAICRVLHTALNISEISEENHLPLDWVAETYFFIGGAFGLVTFRDAFTADNREGAINSRARLSIRDDIDLIQRKLTVLILKKNNNKQNKNVGEMILHWQRSHESDWNRWQDILNQFDAHQEIDYTQVFILLREMMDVISAIQSLESVN